MAAGDEITQLFLMAACWNLLPAWNLLTAAQSHKSAVQGFWIGDAPPEPVLLGSVSSCLTVIALEMTACLLDLLSDGLRLPQASS